MIIESIVTTVAADGRVNCAPMGVEWGDEVIVLKPFLDTATYRNVRRDERCGRQSHRRCASVRACRDLEPGVSDEACRCRSRSRAGEWLLVAGVDRPLDRQHAAAIAHRDGRSCTAASPASSSASIAHGMPCSKPPSTRPACTCWNGEFIDSEMARLQVIVDKTAGPDEHEAMALLTDFVRRGGNGRSSDPPST